MSAQSAIEETLRRIVREVVREEVRTALDERTHSSPRNSNTTSDDGYLSLSRAAKLADVAPGTLRRWIKEGRIPTQRAGRVYRVSRTDLETFLKSGQSSVVVEKARSFLRRAA
jgi:excisionase family DNA binding protein